jgi:hypothetical protein
LRRLEPRATDRIPGLPPQMTTGIEDFKAFPAFREKQPQIAERDSQA